jgi:hypothetical protein
MAGYLEKDQDLNLARIGSFIVINTIGLALGSSSFLCREPDVRF